MRPEPRPYAEVLDAWRISCPRLPVWEQAHARGYVVRRRGAVVAVSAADVRANLGERGDQGFFDFVLVNWTAQPAPPCVVPELEDNRFFGDGVGLPGAIEDDVEIHALARPGWSVSAIARHTGRDRKTVRKYLTGQPPMREPAPSCLEPFRDYLVARFVDDAHVDVGCLDRAVSPHFERP